MPLKLGICENADQDFVKPVYSITFARKTETEYCVPYDYRVALEKRQTFNQLNIRK